MEAVRSLRVGLDRAWPCRDDLENMQLRGRSPNLRYVPALRWRCSADTMQAA